MVKKNNYFLISGFLSLSIFTFFLVLFFYMLFSSSKINSYALVKDTYISISMTTPIIETKKIKKNVSSVVENTVEPIESKEVDIDELFSDVWTQNIKKTEKKIEKKIDNKRLQNIQKRIKTSENKEISKISDKITDIEMNNSDENTTQSSTSNEVNEYLAKIQALVYRYFNPPLNSQGNSVKAVIQLSAIGKVLDFRILNYSANVELNEESDKIKKRLMSVIFPQNPENKTVNYIIILTSKE